MICYRDMTFCLDFTNGECVNSQCRRAFTDGEAAIAKRWWGNDDGEVPVAFSHFLNGCDQVQRPEAE